MPQWISYLNSFSNHVQYIFDSCYLQKKNNCIDRHLSLIRALDLLNGRDFCNKNMHFINKDYIPMIATYHNYFLAIQLTVLVSYHIWQGCEFEKNAVSIQN